MARPEAPNPFIGPASIYQPRDPGLYRSPAEVMRQEDSDLRKKRQEDAARRQGRRK